MFFFVDKTRHIMLEYTYTIKKHGGSKKWNYLERYLKE
jgi:hypothetical protein